jgi:hypothetical protein
MPLVTGLCTSNTYTHHHPTQRAHFSQDGKKKKESNTQAKQHTSQATLKPNKTQVKQHASQTTLKPNNTQIKQHTSQTTLKPLLKHHEIKIILVFLYFIFYLKPYTHLKSCH